MKLGFNTRGNNQTYNRTTVSVCLGKLRNTIASTTRKFKFCNINSPDLNTTFRATRILNADFISPYKSYMFFFLYIFSCLFYFYSNLYYKHK